MYKRRDRSKWLINISVLSLIGLCFLAGQAYSQDIYQTGVVQISSRVYEDGRTFYRFYFYVQKNGAYLEPWEMGDLLGVVLEQIDTGGTVLGTMEWERGEDTDERPFNEIKFTIYDDMNPDYDPINGFWVYGLADNTAWNRGKYFLIDISVSDFEDTFDVDNDEQTFFDIKVKFRDDEVVKTNKPYRWNGLLKLPFVSSESITMEQNNDGVLITWEKIPESFGMDYQAIRDHGGTRVDVFLDFEERTIQYENPSTPGGHKYPASYVKYIDISVPTHMNKVFIPAPFFEWLKAQYEECDLSVAVKTRDGNNISFSRRMMKKLEFTSSF